MAPEDVRLPQHAACHSSRSSKSAEGAEEYNAPRLNLKVSDFDILRRLGDGSFSTVILARHRASGREYAVKMINKHLIMRHKVVNNIRNERAVLDRLVGCEGIAQLQFTFQDADSLYLGLEHCPGGELYEQLQARGRLPLQDAQFYAAEIVLMLQALRRAEVVHRDLKPENLLLDARGHLQLIDFGSAKPLFLPPQQRSPGNRATSFVGTAEYVSPEVLENSGISYASDLWALGCVIFQMLAGRPPFKGPSEYMTFQLVSGRMFRFPGERGWQGVAPGLAEEQQEQEEQREGQKWQGEEAFPPAARDLVDRLLQLDPSDRLGADDLQQLMCHPFFEGSNWDTLRSGPAPTPAQLRGSSGELDGLDWEMNTLREQGTPFYEYVQQQGTAA